MKTLQVEKWPPIFIALLTLIRMFENLKMENQQWGIVVLMIASMLPQLRPRWWYVGVWTVEVGVAALVAVKAITGTPALATQIVVWIAAAVILALNLRKAGTGDNDGSASR
jgi:hypothetical protein